MYLDCTRHIPLDSTLTRFALLMACCLLGACSERTVNTPPVEPVAAQFVGSDQCAACHQTQFAEWRGSHHELAMQAANDDTVLGDFSGIEAPYFETTASFTKSDGRFLVRVEDENGKLQDYQITHTFGVHPLQQYLVHAPGGRKQALQFAWDARTADQGGQRWYHLYPEEYIGPGDPLHWTGRYFNWNYMCAECHSTNLKLGYDRASDTFDTTYSEISVGCEACHGPGSLHMAQASGESFDDVFGLPADLDDRDGAAWIINPDTGIAARSTPASALQQPESCGRCHSRRSTAAEEYVYGAPLGDTHMVSLLDDSLYHADGRILEEVYVYGSFIQSKMYAAGVTCSDCHNPHSAELHAGPDPNDTCATCHLTTRFATNEHSAEQTGDCVSCHMPATTYMGVDPRRDHSFRLPNTAADPDHYGAAIAAGRKGGANDSLLAGIANGAYPAIARATMLTLLEPLKSAERLSRVLEQLDDPNPLVRIGALRALRTQTPEARAQHGSHLLRDPVRSVRVEAALTYAGVRDLLPLEDSRAFVAAADDYRKAMSASTAMPEAALQLAELESGLGNTAAAGELYEHSLRIGPELATVQHAYGLHKVRAGDPASALKHLHQATLLEPDTPQFAYVYGVALNSLGQPEAAINVLADARDRFPGDFDIAWALSTMYRDAGDRTAARRIATELAERYPENERIHALLDALSTSPIP